MFVLKLQCGAFHILNMNVLIIIVIILIILIGRVSDITKHRKLDAPVSVIPQGGGGGDTT